jgi:hypothetical protein
VTEGGASYDPSWLAARHVVACQAPAAFLRPAGHVGADAHAFPAADRPGWAAQCQRLHVNCKGAHPSGARS